VLTTAGDTVNGTAGNDTITGTGTTYTTGDLIVDASSADADVMTVTFTGDSEAVPTIAGIETMNFNLDAVATAATGGIPGDTALTFGMDLNGINGGNVVMGVTKSPSTVTGYAVENVSDGTTVSSALTATRVSAEADADITLNLTAATTNLLTAQTGTADNLTVVATGSGILTVSDADAEEAISLTNAGGGVTVTDLSAATDTLSSLVISAGGAVTIADSNNIGPVTVTTTSGNITVGGTDFDASTTVSLTTAAGDITANADDAVTSLTASATGDGGAVSAAADGDITINSAALAETITLTATGGIVLTTSEAAGTLVLTAGEASTLGQGVSDVETITIASNSTAATPVTFTSLDGNGTSNGTLDGLVEMDTLNFSGSNSVTFLMPGDDLVLLAAEDTGATDTAAPLVISDTAMTGGTSRFEIDVSAGANALNTRSMVVDQIALSYTVNAGESFLIASGQNFVIAADTGADIAATAPAVAGNTMTITLEDDAVATSANDIAGITLTNVGTLNIASNDAANSTAGGVVMGAVNVGTANAVNLTGSADITLASATAATFNASAYTGALVVSDINQGGVAAFTGGSGADRFISTADEDFSVDGGGGLDTLQLDGSRDYSDNTVTIANIETIDIRDSGSTLAGSVMNGSTALIAGDGGADTLVILATTSTGETIDISNTATTGVVTLTGLAGADSLTGSATTATTFTGAAGSDAIVGGSGVDTVNVLLEAAAADGITLGGGSDSIVIDNASAAATVAPVLVTDYNAGTVATNVDVLTIDESAINAMGTVTALSDTNDTDSDANAAVVVRLTADASTVATCDVVVLSQSYTTDALALAGMATAGSDTFTMGATLDDNDAIIVAYYTGSHTNIAIATMGASGTSSDAFTTVETILTMQNVDNTGVLNTGDLTIVA
jgi:hypothetical protein